MQKIQSMRQFLLSFLFLAAFLGAEAQKFGHTNSLQLIANLPEIAEMDSLLILFQVELQGQADSMVEEFRAVYDKYVNEAQAGTMSKAQAEKTEMRLRGMQERIQQFDKESQQAILQKRQQLYQPVLNKLDEIIMAIGQEEKYDMIFDSSQQALLFLTPADDISAKILSRLK